MLRLPPFEVVSPRTVSEAVEALSAPGARLLAGGTDLLVSLKQRRGTPTRLVSLHAVEELRQIRRNADARTLVLGAGVRLDALERDPAVRKLFPSLATAAASVASPQIRNVGTLGGNIHADTRCRYVNQSPHFRASIGGCLKSHGDRCHVVPAGRRCVAAMCSDLSPVLVSLDASLELRRAGESRLLRLDEYFRADGTAHTRRLSGELLRSVHLPLPEGERRTTYVKWRRRRSIDFALVSLAFRFDLEGSSASSPIRSARVVAGALASQPKQIRGLDRIYGKALSVPEVAELVADAVHDQCRPLDNLPGDAAHRRHMHRVLTRRAVRRLAWG